MGIPALADTIGPSCGSCFGSTYTLTNLGLVGSTATTQTYRIQYDINTAGYVNISSGHYIQQVAIKISNTASAATLVSAPGGAGSWSLHVNSGLANAGCTGAGSGFICAADAANAPANGATHTWIFDVTTPAGGLLTGLNASSIKANYNPPMGLLVSEAITLGAPVPEPAALSLLLGGLGVWGYTRYRSRRGSRGH
jgi:hypothetical protein